MCEESARCLVLEGVRFSGSHLGIRSRELSGCGDDGCARELLAQGCSGAKRSPVGSATLAEKPVLKLSWECLDSARCIQEADNQFCPFFGPLKPAKQARNGFVLA